MDDIYARFNHLLNDLNLSWLDPAHFAEIIHQKGAPLDQCWGFIDGTVRRISRPVRNQRIMFSGHKRVHCIKFQVCNMLLDDNYTSISMFLKWNPNSATKNAQILILHQYNLYFSNG